ncbi:hypothetical protein SAMN03159362_2029 [Pseudomonas sp. NFIX51]|uniref:hypothetical protein n=1 Tax=unclassified Pseudomonas TaxID=196821 RepID=UPI0008B17182|nr:MULTISPECIES: hypothetical protein [unclassified Pseudomonas]SEK85025.1 hypothetical protein SAMN03159414_1483 [Pseudomonas sp. NFACC41-3]SMH43631.1 hypothetical protein SAMN03159362_2029 [Pseudomonas sp. NFIX51]
MTRTFKSLFWGSCMALVAGCTIGKSETFTFTTDMPSNFTYEAVAQYAPVKGETCTVKKPDIGYNQRWRLEFREKYKPDSEIPIYRTVEGCRLVIYRVELDIYAAYGEDRGDFGSDTAVIVVREQLEEHQKRTFDTAGESAINGQCQWFFRTQGPKRRLSKSLICKKVDAQGMVTKGRPVGAYTLDQLPGKTVKLNIKLADEERPAIGDTWVKVPGGWKRCMGKSFEDQYAFCFGNYKDFSTFRMPDGKQCSIYPGCTE